MAWFRRFFVGRRNYSSNSNTNLSLQLTSALFTSAPEGGILTLSRAGGFLNEKLTAQEVEEIRSVFKEHSIIAEVTFTENNLQLLHAQMMEVHDERSCEKGARLDPCTLPNVKGETAVAPPDGRLLTVSTGSSERI